jgi:hypothetical protein
METVLNYLSEFASSNVAQLLQAVLILVVGWIIALAVAALVRGALRRTEVDNRLAKWIMGGEGEEKIEVERWFGRGAFWLVMLFVLVAFFETLGLTAITEPLNRFLVRVFEYAPRLIAPAILALVAWALATGLRFVVRRVLETVNLDARLGDQAGLEEEERVPLARTVSEAVYWLIFLLFLPAILSALHLEGLLQPVQGMLDKVLAFLPNLFAAGLILGFGWLLARIIQRLVTNLLAAIGVDRFGEQHGIDKALGQQKLSGVIGLLVYILVLIPVLIASLNSLRLDAITAPASDMLNAILISLPLLFGAALVLVIAYFVGRVVSGLATNLLSGIGFNNILVKLGLGKEPAEGQRTPSEVVGYLVLVSIMLFATIEAVRLLGFEVLGTLVADFLVFASHIALGLVIFGIGLFLANLAARTIEASTTAQARLLALAARVSIMVLAGAMALRQMGLANEIITIAFGLMLGAIAVATALAFGLGCRGLAEDAMKDWLGKVKTTD